jgi:BioD-like phosphotransacetylase family protein
MRNLLVASVDAYAGKSLTALILGLHMRDDGLKVGYFKPVGTLPAQVGAVRTDEDAYFIAQQLGTGDPVECLCPVLLTEDLAEAAFRRQLPPLLDLVRESLECIRQGKDVVIVGGIGDLSRAAMVGLAARQVAELLDLKTLLIGRFEGNETVERFLMGAQVLGDRLLGCLLNFVPEDVLPEVREGAVPYLESAGLPVVGVVPKDDALAAVTLRELVERLDGKLLCCEERLDELVQNFVIGAMNVQSAARYFQETADKVVITGGDRPDIQLAALQTPTKAIILTGNLYPSEIILRRAKHLGVPMILVAPDTMTTVGAIERAVSRMRVREPVKIARARRILEPAIDFDKLYALMDMRPPG